MRRRRKARRAYLLNGRWMEGTDSWRTSESGVAKRGGEYSAVLGRGADCATFRTKKDGGGHGEHRFPCGAAAPHAQGVCTLLYGSTCGCDGCGPGRGAAGGRQQTRSRREAEGGRREAGEAED